MTPSYKAKSARLESDAALVNAGSGPGVMELLSSAGVVLASGNLAKPCGTTSNTDTLTLVGPIVLTAVAVGTMASGRVRDSAGNDVWTDLTVGVYDPGLGTTTSADIKLLKTAQITQVGQTVALATATIQHAA